MKKEKAKKLMETKVTDSGDQDKEEKEYLLLTTRLRAATFRLECNLQAIVAILKSPDTASIRALSGCYLELVPALFDLMRMPTIEAFALQCLTTICENSDPCLQPLARYFGSNIILFSIF